MGGQWTLVQPEGLSPAPRGAHASVTVGSKVLVFGGADRAPITFNDLWMLETEGGRYSWTRISPSLAAGCKLLPRSGATLTAVAGKVYMFGGTEPVSGVCFNELKVLDVDTWTWSDVEAQGTSPPHRHSHCAGCMAETCMIVYGGAGYKGPMQDVWIYNTLQNSWSRAPVSGEQPAAREMHTGCMVDATTLLVYGGRGAEYKVLCDAALFDVNTSRWTSIEPTPFSRCAHSCVLLPAGRAVAHASSTGSGEAATNPEAGTATNGSSSGNGAAASSSSSSTDRVLIYGGYSGEAVEGDVLSIDARTLEIELVRRGPRESDKGGTVPPARFAHSAAVVAAADPSAGAAMVVFGGVNPNEDLNDVAVWQ